MITEEQKIKRQKFIGSSDVAAILGLDPFKTQYDLWLEKTNKLHSDNKDSTAMKRGNYLEPAILAYAADELGELITNPQELEFIEQSAKLIDHPDALVKDSRKPVEAKSKNLFSTEKWGEPYTDDIPDRCIVQSHVHMICTKTDYCHIPVYLPLREFQMFGTPLVPSLVEYILESIGKFWRHVENDTPPDGLPTISVINRVIRTPRAETQIPADIMRQWLQCKDELKAAEHRLAEAEAALKKALGTAEVGLSDEVGRITFYETERKSYTVPAGKYRVLKYYKSSLKSNSNS